MSLAVQWVICGALVAAALITLLRHLGLGARRTGAGPACSGCAHCPAAEEVLQRLKNIEQQPD